MTTLKILSNTFKTKIKLKDSGTIAGFIVASVAAALGIRKIIDILYRKINNYPPGPCGMPIFGCLFKNILENSFYKYLSTSYGSVAMVKVGFRYITFVSDVDIIKKSFKSMDFSTKSPDFASTESIASLNGKKFLERRQLFLRSFISIINSSYLNTVGGKDLEMNWLKEFDNFAKNKESFCPEPYLQYGVFTMLFRALFGDYVKIPGINDADYKDHLTFWDELALESVPDRIWDYGMKPFFQTKRIAQSVKAFEDIAAWVINFEKAYESKKDEYKGDEPLVASLLQKQVSKSALYSDVSIVLIGGITTTKSFLTRILVMLCVMSDVQAKIYNELKEYENKYGEFKLKNIHELHYLRAACHEAFRSKSNGVGLERYVAKKNLKLGGYNLPKGTLVYPAYSILMHDDKRWKDAGVDFNINNFLDKNNRFKNNVAFTIFGSGKRSCPGQSLAERELYYVFGRLVLRYKFKANEDVIKKVKLIGNARLTPTDPWKYIPIMFERR